MSTLPYSLQVPDTLSWPVLGGFVILLVSGSSKFFTCFKIRKPLVLGFQGTSILKPRTKQQWVPTLSKKSHPSYLMLCNLTSGHGWHRFYTFGCWCRPLKHQLQVSHLTVGSNGVNLWVQTSKTTKAVKEFICSFFTIRPNICPRHLQSASRLQTADLCSILFQVHTISELCHNAEQERRVVMLQYTHI